MKRKIVFLPLDERPCNFDFPFWIVEANNKYTIVRPSKKILGNRKIPAKYENIKNFLIKNVVNADILVMSIEMLVYGGLVPSRLHHFSKEEINKRLEIISAIKKINPSIKIYCFSLILRCPTYNTNEEEPDYYKQCGERIFKYGVLKNRFINKEIDQSSFDIEKKTLLKGIEKNVLDYEKRREINLYTIETFLNDYIKYVDYYNIPQDDSNPLGYTTLDREKVLKLCRDKNVTLNMYPGSDDVCMVILVKAILEDNNYRPTVFVKYPKKECENIIPMYEDREINKTLSSQLFAIDMDRINNADKADLILYMNYPTREMVNMGSEPSLGYQERNLPLFVNDIVNSIKNNKKVIICDGAYGNGGEEELLKLIQKQTSLFNLTSYAGWNTSSNSLGTVLAQGALIALFGDNNKHKEFLAERFLEDVGFCGKVRWHIWHDVVPKYGYSYEDIGSTRGIIVKKTLEEIIQYFNNDFPEVLSKYKIVRFYSPWRRMFEIGITVKEK